LCSAGGVAQPASNSNNSKASPELRMASLLDVGPFGTPKEPR
jgi:hypothetical protein